MIVLLIIYYIYKKKTINVFNNVNISGIKMNNKWKFVQNKIIA